MAGKFGPQSAFIFVDGRDLRAIGVQGLSHKDEALQELTDGLGDASSINTPIGKSQFSMQVTGGFFETSAASNHDALAAGPASSPQAVPRVALFGFAGLAAGAPIRASFGEYQQAYEVMAQRDALTKANVTYSVAGRHEKGQIVQTLDTKTADWDTESAPVDYAADTQQRVIPITSNSQQNPTVVTTPVPHGLTSGDKIVIAGNTGSNAAINGEQTVTVISSTTFSVPVNATTAGGTGGAFVKADSANGAVGHLHVLACTGFTNFVGKLRDSPDGSTFADLVTFADNVSAPFAEAVEVAGVVDRYVAFDGNVTGTGSVRLLAALCRR